MKFLIPQLEVLETLTVKQKFEESLLDEEKKKKGRYCLWGKGHVPRLCGEDWVGLMPLGYWEASMRLPDGTGPPADRPGPVNQPLILVRTRSHLKATASWCLPTEENLKGSCHLCFPSRTLVCALMPTRSEDPTYPSPSPYLTSARMPCTHVQPAAVFIQQRFCVCLSLSFWEDWVIQITLIQSLSKLPGTP